MVTISGPYCCLQWSFLLPLTIHPLNKTYSFRHFFFFPETTQEPVPVSSKFQEANVKLLKVILLKSPLRLLASVCE